jgi:transcriptional regulator with XRE-family HTH domain
MAEMDHEHSDSGAQQFAALIKTAREKAGLTQSEFAERANLSRPTIARWESGKAERPDPHQVRAACEAFDISPTRAAVALGYLPPEEDADENGAPTDDAAITKVMRSNLSDDSKRKLVRLLIEERERFLREREARAAELLQLLEGQ